MTDSIELNEEQDLAQAEEKLKQRLASAIAADWQTYYQTINQLSVGYEIAPSLKLLHIADELLNQTNDFSQSSDIERFLVGGVQDNKVTNTYSFDTRLLGDMQGFASFKKLVKKDPEGLTKLLRIIPSNGPVDGWHFMQFVDAFQQLFTANSLKQAYVYPLTRLMTMKRPDQFVALNKESAEIFCKALTIKPLKNNDFQRYWDDIILPIQKSPWYKTDMPMEVAELAIYRARFALLERIICTPVVETEITSQVQEQAQSIASSSNETAPNSSHEEASIKASASFIAPQPAITMKKKVEQPKKMTIAKKKSAKVNQNAATKLMSQYYFANKEKFSKVNMAAHRESIINKLIDGESVEEAFSEILNAAK
jgi:hypothetical protein